MREFTCETTDNVFPHARRCTDAVRERLQRYRVFPACARMPRGNRAHASPTSSIPRVRADAPSSLTLAERPLGIPRVRADAHRRSAWSKTSSLAYSPCARGCTCSVAQPRTPPTTYSPRARGCTGLWVRARLALHVFPACARMHRSAPCPARPSSCVPRVRADAPWEAEAATRQAPYSPRARGCTAPRRRAADRMLVFPACARMHRTSSTISGGHGVFPAFARIAIHAKVGPFCPRPARMPRRWEEEKDHTATWKTRRRPTEPGGGRPELSQVGSRLPRGRARVVLIG